MPRTRRDDPWLTTERLALRRFTAADRGWLLALYADADVTRGLGGVRTAAQVDEILATRVLEFYDTHPGLGIWVTLERTTSAPVGFHLLNHPYGESCVQVGFVLAKDAWGRGFGTEMARALLRYGFADLALPRIIGITTRDNLASQRVLTKIGLRRGADRQLAHPAYAAEGVMAWFERDRDEWLTG